MDLTFMPFRPEFFRADGVPKYALLWDNRGLTLDRYAMQTIRGQDGRLLFAACNAEPTLLCGVYRTTIQRGRVMGLHEAARCEQARWCDLPVAVRRAFMDDYCWFYGTREKE